MDGRPLLYDLYCGSGGSSRGFQQAGFRVVGVDFVDQPHYVGDGFYRMDALEFVGRVLSGEIDAPDAWAASPPCQAFSSMRNLPWLAGKDYPALILPTRELLAQTGQRYVIENVMGARWGSNPDEDGLSRRGWAIQTRMGYPDEDGPK